MINIVVTEQIMKVVDFFMCLECFLYPVYVGDVLFVGVLMRVWNIVDARSIYLIPLIVDQPFFSFPSTPLNNYEIRCVYPFKIFFCCSNDTIITTSTFSFTHKVITYAIC